VKVQKSEVEGEVEALRANLAHLQENLAAAEKAREKLVCEQIELTATVQRHEVKKKELSRSNSDCHNDTRMKAEGHDTATCLLALEKRQDST